MIIATRTAEWAEIQSPSWLHSGHIFQKFPSQNRGQVPASPDPPGYHKIHSASP